MLKIQFKDKRKPAMWLVDSTLKIGSDKSCELFIDEPSVDPVHVELIVQNGEILLKNVSQHRSVFVNEVPIVKEQKLTAWDIIKVGASELEVVDPLKQRESEPVVQQENKTVIRPAVSPWMLKALTAPLDGQYFSLSNGQIIGRDKEAEITLPLSFISRQHAKIALRKEKVYIEDLNSSNGTYVNGEKIKSAELRNGDELRLDQFAFSVIGPVSKLDSKPRTVVRDAIAKGSIKKSATPTNPDQKKTLADKTVYLHGLSAEIRGKVFTIPNVDNHISRMLGHHLSTSERSVSARHVYLSETDYGWEIRNNGASDGLLVNGKMQSRVVLQDGDEVTVGGTHLKFQCSGNAPLKLADLPEPPKSKKGIWLSLAMILIAAAAVVVVTFK
ncbi:FHA domain-containing protein [Aliikangiella sp. IMCC44632]